MAFKRIWHQAEVLATLAAGATVVTSGERLARAVRLAYGEARQADGTAVWERPDVLSYGAFLNRLYDSAVNAALSTSGNPPPRRISEAVAQIVWEEAIGASPAGSALLQVAAAAREAQRAWNLMWAYRIPPERVAAAEGEDAGQFAAWSNHFRQKSREQGWLEDARLADWLATQVRAGSLVLAPRIICIGFDELTPQQRELLESLRAGGSDVTVMEMRAAATQATRRLEDDAAAEMRAAAAWARALLERDPSASIGIVTRDLDERCAALARALDDALCPSAAAGQPGTRAYDLSSGMPLSSYPVVHASLAVLELLRVRVPFLTVSLLLRSPFLTGAEHERDTRARLELRLRGRGSEEIGLKPLLAFAGNLGGMPLLMSALQSLRDKAAALPARQRPSAWARDFADVLTRTGWPGERPLDSGEYQAVMALQDLMGSLVQMDAALGAIPLGEALTRLRRLCADHSFQPATLEAPVQVIDLWEASGLSFDHLWIMGMSDADWPASPRPAAFIPPRLQREYNLPHASAALELEFARRITERALASSTDTVVSSPRSEADEELRPSPLIASLALMEPEQIAGTQAYRTQLQAEYTRAAETYMDVRGPAVGADETIRGGAYLLASQSACPFQAFGTYRLRAEPLEEPALGPDALERGNLMHTVLHTVWTELKDHAGLAARDATARRELASRSAATAVGSRAQALPEVYTPRVAELEQERLTRRVTAWLELEARRPPFRVRESETEHHLKIGPLTLSVRMDRIDELAGGGHLLLDYKTGRVKLQAWLDERPDDPQLPLYALGERDGLAAVSYACLKPGETGFMGLAAGPGMPEGIGVYAEKRTRPTTAPDWDGLLKYWEKNLAVLAEEYAAGDARIHPKRAQTCERCHLSTLCRIHELRGAELEETEDEEAGDDE